MYAHACSVFHLLDLFAWWGKEGVYLSGYFVLVLVVWFGFLLLFVCLGFFLFVCGFVSCGFFVWFVDWLFGFVFVFFLQWQDQSIRTHNVRHLIQLAFYRQESELSPFCINYYKNVWIFLI